MKRTSRRPSKLSESLHQRLNSYALAASAAGVGVLALIPPAEYVLPSGAALAGLLAVSEPAEAKIVYTPAHQNVTCQWTHNRSKCYGAFNLDLNHDNVVDFRLIGVEYSASARLMASGEHGNEMEMNLSHYVAALHKQVPIHSKSNFGSGKQVLFRKWPGSSDTWGPWWHVSNRYVGLRFKIRGKLHYGWVRMRTLDRHGQGFATLTGYAYETIPNKSIIAGKTHGKDVITVEPRTLGHLARGASALPSWRAKESK